MAKFFCGILRADRLLDGGVAFTAKAYAIVPEEPVELEGVGDLTLTGDADALFGYFGKVVELVPVGRGDPAAVVRGDSGQVG